MKNSFAGSSLLLFLVLIGLTSGCAKPETLRFAGIEDFRFSPKSLSLSELGADILIYNPNRKTLYVKYVDADLYLNDRAVAYYVSDSSFSIPGRDTFRYPLKLEVSNTSLLGGALDFLKGGKKQYRIKGTAKAGTRSLMLKMPFDETGELKF